MKKIVYCTLDTETVGGAACPTGTYNLSGWIHYGNGEVLATFNYLVAEHFDEIRYDDYAKKNFHLYQKMIDNGEITVIDTEEMALNAIKGVCNHYGVKYVMAYNSSFDFEKTICRELVKEIEFIDIYLMALQSITHLKKYAKFCRENGFRSSSKRSVATTAESVYAFITGNPNYEEEHTALEDSKIEMQIFLACKKMHKKFTKNCHAWNCKENKCFPKWAE